MRIYRYIMALFMLFALTTSSHAVSIKLDGTGGLSSGTDCQTGAIYRFGTETSYNGQQLDLLVEVIGADNDYNNGTTYCTYVKDGTLATNLRDTDSGDNVAFEEYQVTIVRQGTSTPVEVDRLMLTGYDLDINGGGGTDTDDFYVAADGAYITGTSAVTHTSGLFYGSYTDKMKGWGVDNCDDSSATPDVTCRASSIWINGTTQNKVSTIKVRVQNDNAYGEYTGDSYAYRLIQLSFQIEDFGNIFNGQKEYGDAPSTYGTAGGELDGTIMLGNGLPADAESSYQSSSDASADDSDAGSGDYDDDNAVMLSGTTTTLGGQFLNAGDTLSLDVTTYGSGYLQIWFDFNGDGDFLDAGEHVVNSQLITNTGESVDGITTNTSASSGVSTTPISFTIPSTTKSGNSFIRVRFSEGDSANEKDPRSDLSLRGEIEDYQVSIANEGSISGNVKDSLSNNLSGIIVKLMNGTAEVANATTDTNGNYTFASVAIGNYTIVNTATNTISISDEDTSDDGDTTTNSNLTDKSIPVSISDGEADNNNNFIQTMPGTISGNVTNPAIEGIDGATISIMTTGTGSTIVDNINGNPLTSTTDANGHYSFIHVPLGSYTITQTDKAGYTSVSDIDGANDNKIAITITASGNYTNQDFVDTLPTGTISGTVKDNLDVAMQNVTIKLFASDGTSIAKDNNGANVPDANTDINGAFSFTNLAAGNYVIKEINPANYTSLSDDAGDDQADNTNQNDDSIPVTLALGETDDDNIFVDKLKPGTISGNVKDIDNNNLSGIVINLMNGTTIVDTATTDANGNYTFTNVAVGEYNVVNTDTLATSITDADESEDGDTTSNGDFTDKSIPVTIAAEETDADNNFVHTLPITTGTISGFVKDDANNPIAGAIVKLMDGTIEIASFTTLADGAFSFTTIPAGSYTLVETNHPHYISVSDDAVDDQADNTNQNDDSIPVTLAVTENDNDNIFVDKLKSGTISGSVKESNGAAISGVTIIIQDNAANIVDDTEGNPLTNTTDANGNYSFDKVPEGNYFIKESDKTGYVSVSDADNSADGDGDANGNTNDNIIPVTITNTKIDTNNDFIDRGIGSISGFVKDDANNPITGAKIELVLPNGSPALDNNGNTFTRFTTLADGAFSFTNIPQGDYMLLEVNADGYISVSDNADDDQALNSDTTDDFIPVTLTAGENDDDNIFIDKKASGSISGFVKDVQGNALENVTITLQDNSANTVNDIEANPLTTTTDVSGFYSFIKVPEGDYIIVESDKVDYISTSDTDSVADNDNTPNTDTNDNKIPVTITDSESDTENNFVDEGLKSISGKVLVDTDGDEVGDKGLANVIVNLNSCGTNTFSNTTTDANGLFSFDNLVAGCYTLSEVDPVGYNSVKDMDSENDNNITVTLSDSDIANQIFIDEPSLNVSGNVKADNDFDGIVDEALPNVTIELYAFDDALLETVQTDVNGDYTFTNVTPGTYTILESDPEGYASLRDVDGDDANSIMIAVTESDIIGQNFEDQKRITVSGVVKVDIDGDNIVDEPLKNSTLVICKVVDPCTADNNIAKVITDEDGAYKFDDLEPGDYKIIEIDKDGYESIGDVDGANDNTININLTGNGDVTDQDFDNKTVALPVILTKNVAKKQASIGDFVPYSITVENVNDSYNYAALRIRDVLPAGFKYEKGSARLIRGTSKTTIDATGTNIVEFGSFNLSANEKVTLSYLLKVGVGVAKGEHINTATANQNGEDVSNTSTASVTIIADPFIDNSIVIGKVFADNNGNGIQDEGESGIPGVRLATVTGMLIETDGYGRYHVADAESSGFGGRGSNFIVKVDKATLPEGSDFTTENPRVLRITASGLNVIDFGVTLPKIEKLSKERIIKKTTMKKELVEVQKDITMGSIYFDSDQDCIRPNQVASLCAIADKLREYQGGSIMIEANTDARAPIWYNKKLAYKRAQSVYKELKQQLGDEMIGNVEVIYDNCESEVRFDPRYDWWGKPNAPKTKKECTQFGISKKHCNTLLNRSQGGAL